MTEHIAVGAKVKFVGDPQNVGLDFIEGAVGTLVGYWDPDGADGAPLSTVPTDPDWDFIPYPYYVEGLTEGENPKALPVYGKDELLIVEEGN